jgi:exonuclease III
MKLIGWNIRAGGGKRVPAMLDQFAQWQPDLVALSEFRGTDPSLELAHGLRAHGLVHQRLTTVADNPAMNALCLASKWPLRSVRTPATVEDPQRWLHVSVAAPEPFSVILVHVPNRVTGRKFSFLNQITKTVTQWHRPGRSRSRPALVIGDTNSGQIDIDEENPAFIDAEDQWLRTMGNLGWLDAYRHRHGKRRAYSWYSPNGNNGFRLDQAFVNSALIGRLSHVSYQWAGATPKRRSVLSDHASLHLHFN